MQKIDILENNNFGKLIKKIRKSKKITQEDLAEKIEMQTSYISKIERGAVEPRLNTILKLKNALNISGNKIIGEADQNLIDKLRIRFEEIEKMPNDKQKYIIEFLDMSIQNYSIERFVNGEMTFKEMGSKILKETKKEFKKILIK
jgi:transcriptional regulator with XRE-family HTH domain